MGVVGLGLTCSVRSRFLIERIFRVIILIVRLVFFIVEDRGFGFRRGGYFVGEVGFLLDSDRKRSVSWRRC